MDAGCECVDIPVNHMNCVKVKNRVDAGEPDEWIKWSDGKSKIWGECKDTGKGDCVRVYTKIDMADVYSNKECTELKKKAGYAIADWLCLDI